MFAFPHPAKRLLPLLVCLLACAARAQQPPLRCALLTCSAGTDAYTLFGHTALRVQGAGFDLAFNYGQFSFQSEHFIYRFVKGQTDYELGAEDYDRFVGRYTRQGFTVREQELLLDEEARERLLALLLKNHEPENRVYRYNFLYDNCTTRALQVIEQAVGHELDFAASADTLPLTHRQILHPLTRPQPWLAFGIDMVLGQEVDRPLVGSLWRQRLFIPARLAEGLRAAGLTGEEVVHEPTRPMERANDFPIPPHSAALLLLFAAIAVSWHERKYGSAMNWAGCALDVALHLLQGVAGIVVAFLFFLSEHPAVGSNWLVVCLNPLAFVLVAQDLRLKLTGRPLWRLGRWDVVDSVNLAATAGIFIASFMPGQWIHPAMRTMALILAIRALAHLTYKSQSWHKKNNPKR